MSKKYKECCNKELITFEEVKSKCKVLKEYENRKVLIKTIHLDTMGHYQYFYIDCENEPCKCYLLDIKKKVLHPDLVIEEKIIKEVISTIKKDQLSTKKTKSRTPGI